MKEWISPIPLKIHLIWIGNQEYPKHFEYFLTSFYEKLPEFEIKIWGNKDLNSKNFPITLPYIKKAQKLQGKQMIDEEGYKMYDENMKIIGTQWIPCSDRTSKYYEKHGIFYQLPNSKENEFRYATSFVKSNYFIYNNNFDGTGKRGYTVI